MEGYNSPWVSCLTSLILRKDSGIFVSSSNSSFTFSGILVSSGHLDGSLDEPVSHCMHAGVGTKMGHS